MKLRLTAKIQNAGGVKEVYDYVVKGKGREEWRGQYNYVGDFYDGLAVVKLKGKWGWVDTKGHEVIPAKYEQIDNLSVAPVYGFDEYGLCVVRLNWQWGMINRHGEVVVPIKYDEIGGSWRENEAWVKLDGKYGTLKPNGKVFFKTDGSEKYRPRDLDI